MMWWLLAFAGAAGLGAFAMYLGIVIYLGKAMRW